MPSTKNSVATKKSQNKKGSNKPQTVQSGYSPKPSRPTRKDTYLVAETRDPVTQVPTPSPPP